MITTIIRKLQSTEFIDYIKNFFREFIEAQKIWVVRERERVDKENREIAAFIENKDKWKVKVNFCTTYD